MTEGEFLTNFLSKSPESQDFKFELESEINQGNTTHKRYSLKYQGYKIYSESLRLHIKGQNLYLVNGELLKLDLSKAVFLGAHSIQNHHAHDLLWIRSDANTYQLAEVQSNESLKSFIAIDSKEKIFDFDMIAYCDSIKCRSHLPYQNGIQEFNVSFENDLYQLKDECRMGKASPIITMLGNGASPTSIIVSENNTWDNSISSSAAQCHWASAQFYDFLLSTFNRNSFDDKGAEMIAVLDTSLKNGASFSYTGMYALIGVQANNINQSWATIDIVAHEWTHPLIFTENILLWNNEGRAVSEGICDVFGAMAEFYVEGKFDSLKSGDWQIAEDVLGLPLRSIDDPNSVALPDTYNSPLYITGNSKYDRSGPFSYWFYLMSEGGIGVNDHNQNPYTYSVNGIGKEKAFKILYHSMIAYLTDQSDYSDTRWATQEAAKDLYGECSDEHKNTIEAWKAVGVYDSLKYCQNTNLSGIQNLNKTSIYPNPGNGIFTFSFDQNFEAKIISIFDSNGQLIQVLNSASELIQIDLTQESEGVYFYKVQSESNSEVGKIIKL